MIVPPTNSAAVNCQPSRAMMIPSSMTVRRRDLEHHCGGEVCALAKQRPGLALPRRRNTKSWRCRVRSRSSVSGESCPNARSLMLRTDLHDRREAKAEDQGPKDLLPGHSTGHGKCMPNGVDEPRWVPFRPAGLGGSIVRRLDHDRDRSYSLQAGKRIHQVMFRGRATGVSRVPGRFPVVGTGVDPLTPTISGRI